MVLLRRIVKNLICLISMDVELKKDKKGACYILSHMRCGFTECLFLTEAELYDVAVKIKKIIGG